MTKRTRAGTAASKEAPIEADKMGVDEAFNIEDGQEADQDAPQEEVDGEERRERIRFREAISWQAGKTIQTTELLRRLQTLAQELKDFDQEAIDKSSLTHVAHELVSPNLLRHKDKGVKAWTAHCLVDILRLAAPDAPFSRQQLQDIFTLFVLTNIPNLADASDAYYSPNLHVLHALLVSKAIVLITDIGSSSKLITSLFASCFDILSQPGDAVNKNLEYDLTGLLHCLVEECDSLPSEVVDTILAQFLRADPQSATIMSGAVKGKKQTAKSEPDPSQTRLVIKQLPPSYNVAANICNTCVDRMSRHVAQYFSNILLSASGSASALGHSRAKQKKRAGNHEIDDDDDDVELHRPSDEDVERLELAHRLLREMWKTCPGVLHSVVPQLEAELSSENGEFRKIATEAIGDMISGIGVESSLLPAILDPAAYPPLVIDAMRPIESSQIDSRVPRVTQSFSQSHSGTYHSFIARRHDKASEVRAAWTTAIGRALSTSAGGIGLNQQEQQDMVGYISQMLVDSDDKVRTAAIKALTLLDFRSFISKIGSSQPIPGSEPIMNQLADRAKDKDATVRVEAAHFLGKLWGVGAHEIAAGNEEVNHVLGDIPTKILNGRYADKPEINALIDRVLFESLIPLGYPIQKRRVKRPTNSNSQIETEAKELSDQDGDRIRVQRLLVLFQGLDDRAKMVLLAMMGKPAQLGKSIKQYLKLCEEYNGNTMDKNGKEIRKNLGRTIEWLSQLFPDGPKTAEDLWTFANKNDRRSYALIRFSIAEDSDYRKIYKSIKELLKRFEENLGLGTSTVPDTMTSLMYKVSNLFYNKSHVNPIMDVSCHTGHPLVEAAQTVLKDLSTRAPGIFKTHGQELGNHIVDSAPNASRTNDSGALATLKTYANFARSYRDDVPKEKKFVQAMMKYVLKGSPPSAAKYAVAIIMLSTDKKEMHAKDILKDITKGFKYGSELFLSKLAALSQLMLLHASEMDEEKEVDIILQIALRDILSRAPPKVDDVDSAAFTQDVEAREWALKILANRLRSYLDAKSVKDIKDPIYQLLNKYISDTYEADAIQSKAPSEILKSRLRLQAAKLILKLCSHADFDNLLTPKAFNSLMWLSQDADAEVREGFVNKVKKYLGQGRLGTRFYNAVFLLAFEPIKGLQTQAAIWLHARATQLAKTSTKHALETAFARFLSVLAHHPDYGQDLEDLEGAIQYMMFYLKNVATADNISLIYLTVQRLKTVKDAIDPTMSERLYFLSDLAVAVINSFTSIHNWPLQAQAAKPNIPSGIFALIKDHDESQQIAETQYLSEEIIDQIDGLVRANFRPKKRKSDFDIEHPAKRRAVKSEHANGGNDSKLKSGHARKPAAALKANMKSPRKGRATEADDSEENEAATSAGAFASESASRRKSSRAAGRKSYAEAEEEDDDGDAEMEEWEEEDMSANGNKENRDHMELD